MESMKQLSILMAMVFLGACGVDASDYRDTCFPDPSEARAIVTVAVINEADHLHLELESLYESIVHPNPHEEHWRVWHAIEQDAPQTFTLV